MQVSLEEEDATFLSGYVPVEIHAGSLAYQLRFDLSRVSKKTRVERSLTIGFSGRTGTLTGKQLTWGEKSFSDKRWSAFKMASVSGTAYFENDESVTPTLTVLDVEPSAILAQHGTVTVDWKAELAKAKAGIEKNPKSAFWHNQAGVAYDALGDFENAVKELKLASTLDPSNPIDDYALYALYKRRGMHPEQREVLLNALENDPKNPFGRFEFAFVLEKEKALGGFAQRISDG